MRRIVAVIITVFLTVIVIVPVQAQSPVVIGEHIERFDSTISIDETNTATITETITYNFGSLQRHGIERFIPYRTKAEGTKKYFYYNFDFKDASLAGEYVQSSLRREGEYEVVRLGDPNKTITGSHVYRITYEIDPVLLKDKEGDYLNWNITGNYWNVPIRSVAAYVTFTNSDTVTKSRCYTGTIGSKESDCSAGYEKNSAVFETTRVLNPQEGLTVNVLVPQGSLRSDSLYQQAINPPLPNLLPLSGYLFGIVAVALGLIRKIRIKREQNNLRDKEIVVAQYDVPDGLSPGEIGHLSDNSSSMAEITATIIDLAVRGYIRIEQTQTKGILKKADYTIHKLKEDTHLREYEKKLMMLLFPDTFSEIKVSDLSPTTAAPVISSIKSTFKSSLNKKGYYQTEQPKRSPIIRQLAWIGFGVVVVGNVIALFDHAPFQFVVYSFVATFVGMAIGAGIAYTIRMTESGYDQWAKVEGLKLYLSVAEKDRLNFSDAPERTPKHFNALLPYAIALGVETQWAKQFEGIDVSKSSNWYSSSNSYSVLTASSLSRSLSSEFSASFSTNVTPTQSSSGYSGGGSSGGGGGGGGGGSW